MARLGTQTNGDRHREPGRGRRRLRRRGAVIATAGALTVGGLVGALLATGTAGATSGQNPGPPSDVVQQLEDEIAAMLEEGVPAADPKVEMLEDEVDALAAGAQAAPGFRTNAAPAPGRASTPAEGRRLAAQGGQPAERGPIECEPVPQLLEADEIDGATCLSVPQPDGSSRYLAVGPAGNVHVIRFGAGGDVERLPDKQLPGGRRPADVEMAPNAEGDVEILSDGEHVDTLEVE